MVPANPYPRNKYNQPLFCYIKKYIFYLLALVLAGCTHSGGIKPANTGIQVLQIDWKHISDKLDYAPMVEDSILMFQLEATNECLIGEVTKLIYQNDLIYIADNLGKRVFVFDTTSKLQADIHRVGNGPGEYTHISCFAVHGTEMVIFDHFPGQVFLLRCRRAVPARKTSRRYMDGRFVLHRRQALSAQQQPDTRRLLSSVRTGPEGG